MPRVLEDLRDEPVIGEIAYRIDERTLRPLLFHDYAHTAYYLTVEALRNFERVPAVGPGRFVVPAVTFWFMTVESFVSTLHKTCAVLDESLRAAAWPSLARVPLDHPRQIVEKMTAVKRWIAGPCPPDPPHNRLREFATFRNALLHDLTTHAPRIQYAHSLFSPRAEKCNQVDLIEALSVALEVFSYFRRVFAGADLMPSVRIGAAVEKLDVLAAETVYPAFTDLLAAKHLTSSVGRPRAVATCPAELLAAMQFLLRTEGPVAPTEGRAEGAPLIVDSYLDQATSARPVDDSQFQIADYTRPLEAE